MPVDAQSISGRIHRNNPAYLGEENGTQEKGGQGWEETFHSTAFYIFWAI